MPAAKWTRTMKSWLITTKTSDKEGASTSTASDHENDNGGSHSSEDESGQARVESAEPAATVDSTTEGEFRLKFGNTVNPETPLCVHTHTPPAYAH